MLAPVAVPLACWCNSSQPIRVVVPMALTIVQLSHRRPPRAARNIHSFYNCRRCFFGFSNYSIGARLFLGVAGRRRAVACQGRASLLCESAIQLQQTICSSSSTAGTQVESALCSAYAIQWVAISATEPPRQQQQHCTRPGSSREAEGVFCRRDHCFVLPGASTTTRRALKRQARLCVLSCAFVIRSWWHKRRRAK